MKSIVRRAPFALFGIALAFSLESSASAASNTYAGGHFGLGQGSSVSAGAVTLTFTTAGVLVLSKGASTLWTSPARGMDCSTGDCAAVFHSNGDLVLYQGNVLYWDAFDTFTLSSKNYQSTLILSDSSPYLSIVTPPTTGNPYGSVAWTPYSYAPPPTQETYLEGTFTLNSSTYLDLFGVDFLLNKGDFSALSTNDFSALWDSKSTNPNCTSASTCVATFTSGGNLELTANQVPYWSAGTTGAKLVLNGPYFPNISVIDAAGNLQWSSSQTNPTPPPAPPPAGCPVDAAVYNQPYYQHMNPDLDTAFGSSVNAYLTHWCTFGIHEGRRASADFAVQDYLKMYPDLQAAFIVKGVPNYPQAIQHFITYGRAERRLGTLLNPYVYDETYYRTVRGLATTLTDLQVAQDYLNYGLDNGVQSHPYFSVNAYLKLYPGVSQAMGGVPERAVQDYVTYGLGLGRAAIQNRQPPPTPQNTVMGADLLGAEETVFKTPDQGCPVQLRGPNGILPGFDMPNMAARAFLGADNDIQFMSGHNVMFRMKGSAFSGLQRDCSQPVLTSALNFNNATHRSLEWLEAFYTKDGTNIFGISANDWHGTMWQEPACDSAQNGGCWWGSLTSFVSTDQGRTYGTRTGNPEDYGLAEPVGNANNNPYTPSRYGFFQISNIMKSPLDENYYFMARAEGLGTLGGQQTGICLFRATNGSDLTNVGSWQAYDGTGFNANPSQEQLCQPITSQLFDIRGLSYNTHFGQYLAIGKSQIGNAPPGSIYYVLSSDLIHWTPAGLLYAPPDVQDGGLDYPASAVGYASMIDHAYPYLGNSLPDRAERLNFDLTGSSPYLYFVRSSALDVFHQETRRIQVRFH